MKVLFIIGATPPIPCGVGDQTFNLAKKLAHNFNVKVILYTYYNPKIIEEKGLYVYFFYQSKIKFYIKLIFILLKEKPDSVHISYPNRGFTFQYPFFASIVLRAFVKNLVITFHEAPNKYINKIYLYLITKIPTSYILVRTQIAKDIYLDSYTVITNFSNIPISCLSENDRKELNDKIAKGKKLCAHFGFIAPHRCVDQLFEVLNPEEYHLLLIGDLDRGEYSRILQKKIWSPEWTGNVTITGYLCEEIISNLLFAADVVILPFKDGAHDANTSTKAVTIQGTYLITTSTERHGYDNNKNIFYTTPGNIDEIKIALQRDIVKFPKIFNSEDSILEISKKYYNIFNTQ